MVAVTDSAYAWLIRLCAWLGAAGAGDMGAFESSVRLLPVGDEFFHAPARHVHAAQSTGDEACLSMGKKTERQQKDNRQLVQEKRLTMLRGMVLVESKFFQLAS
jgi:hypothetical protein